jgi:hypothetical protein
MIAIKYRSTKTRAYLFTSYPIPEQFHQHFLIFALLQLKKTDGENESRRNPHDAATPGYQAKIPGCHPVV